ncbi:hypothetical protein TNCV_3501301 [Trichonephila clavipes]|uniref:Uncharacterized protein n=1 Tax=Trichonephila clavipes TaxID=2585209 RepID=A0A8X6S3J9_TRICX|nr:hypothetical protein TNCV_3501301 [Trichonephila clavipes]
MTARREESFKIITPTPLGESQHREKVKSKPYPEKLSTPDLESPLPVHALYIYKHSCIHQDSNSNSTAHQALKTYGKTLTTVDRILSHLERAQAVARFHLTTVHEIMVVYIHWLDLNADKAGPLCGHVRMDGVHLLQNTGLNEYPTHDKQSLLGGVVSNSQEAKHGRWINK